MEQKETPEQKAKRILERDRRDVFNTLRSASSRRFLYRILRASGMFSDSRDSATGFLVNEHGLAHRAGMRDLGLWVQSEIELAEPNSSFELFIEQSKEEHVNHVRTSNS